MKCLRRTLDGRIARKRRISNWTALSWSFENAPSLLKHAISTVSGFALVTNWVQCAHSLPPHPPTSH